MTTYLLFYAQDHGNFRSQELDSILGLEKIAAEVDDESCNSENPFVKIKLERNEDAHKIISRSVLLRFIVTLWGQGTSAEELLQKYPCVYEMAKSLKQDTFCYKLEAFNKKLSMDEKRKWIEALESGGLEFGPVDLRNPAHTIFLLLNFVDEQDRKTVKDLYIGELVGYGQRHLLQQYSLKTRYFIGNTSMDPQLSFLMANQGKVKQGSVVYDPFVGTGSILTCCAHFGAMTAGSDIDYSIVYGRGKSSRAGQNGWRARDEIVRTNYQSYGLLNQYVDIMAADISRLPFRDFEIFDAIITDPPYGIREGGRKQSVKESSSTESCSADSFPAIEKQSLSGVVVSLLECAAKFLVPGGRLVYWLPVYRPSYTEDVIPRHPLLKLIANSEQCLTKKISRRLITMEKIFLGENDLSSIQEVGVVLSDQVRSLHDQFRSNYFSAQQKEK